MDTMTVNMCHHGMARLNYARVLIEVEANKEWKSKIEVQYRDKKNKVKGTKQVDVEYAWKPLVCCHIL